MSQRQRRRPSRGALAPTGPVADAIRRDYPTAPCTRTLAAQLGLTINRLHYAASLLGVPRDKAAADRARTGKPIKKSALGQAAERLTGADLYAIEKRRHQGEPLEAIAKDYPRVSLRALQQLTDDLVPLPARVNGWHQVGSHALAGGGSDDL